MNDLCIGSSTLNPTMDLQLEYPTIQLEDGGATPTPMLHFSRCQLKDVSSFIKQHHYSHSHPGGIDYAFRLDMDGRLSGAATFGWQAGNPKAKHCHNNIPKKTRELMRLVLLNEVPRNSESRFIAWCLRWLKKHTNLEVIVSYADPEFGHSGKIYRASNFLYLGQQKNGSKRLVIDGRDVHPRSAGDTFGTTTPKNIAALGHTVGTRTKKPLHKYIYFLRTPTGDEWTPLQRQLLTLDW